MQGLATFLPKLMQNTYSLSPTQVRDNYNVWSLSWSWSQSDISVRKVLVLTWFCVVLGLVLVFVQIRYWLLILS